MNDLPRNLTPADPSEIDLIDSARNRIAALLSNDDEINLGMAIFDLWAAFDELVDPLNPPVISLSCSGDPAQAMRAAHTELVTSIATSQKAIEALAIGRAAGNVATALATYEQNQ